MQTFLPYPDYDDSARVLDPSRLGNQAYREGKTLISGGWPNHPASKMWRGYEHHLALYCLACLKELKRRGRDYQKWFIYFQEIADNTENIGPPEWMGNEEFHRSHRQALLFTDYEHYSKYFQDEPKLDYVWPVE